MRSRIRRWAGVARRAHLRGQGLAEYGLILVLVAVAAASILFVLGNSVASLYSTAHAKIP